MDLERGQEEIRMVFVDDDPGMHQLVQTLLGFEEGITLVGQAETGAEALATVIRENPDILVIDYRLPDINGLRVCNQVSEKCPQVQLLIISGFAQDDIAGRIRMSGFTFVEKTQAFVDFGGLVRKVVSIRDSLPPRDI